MKQVQLMLITVMLFVVTLYAQQPEVTKVTVVPDSAAIGDSMYVSLEFTGKTADISKVFLTVREYSEDGPEMILKPETKEGKNIWQMTGQVPWDAPSMTYHLEITALDKDGKEIITKEYEKQLYGRAGMFEFIVK